ncbi:hypothetical protein DIPPA_05969 [Diplonema papillatum]|nr:hypothetical protein DIPPA_05969 [Diplonema papillatum]
MHGPAAPPGPEEDHIFTVSHLKAQLDTAVKLLEGHVELIVCSYYSPPVFRDFVDQHLDEDTALAIRQLMRRVCELLPNTADRKKFSTVLVGERDGPRERDAAPGQDEMFAASRGGLIDGDATLLREFLEEYPGFTEYFALLQHNSRVISALQQATEKWKMQHPPRDRLGDDLPPTQETFLPESNNAITPRIHIVGGRIAIRGNCLPPLLCNLAASYPDSQKNWGQVVKTLERFVCDLEQIFVATYGTAAGLVRSLTVNVSCPEVEKQSSELAYSVLASLTSLDPHLDPSELYEKLCQVTNRAYRRMHCIVGKKSVWPGSRAKQLRDAIDRCIRRLTPHKDTLGGRSSRSPN